MTAVTNECGPYLCLCDLFQRNARVDCFGDALKLRAMSMPGHSASIGPRPRQLLDKVFHIDMQEIQELIDPFATAI